MSQPPYPPPPPGWGSAPAAWPWRPPDHPSATTAMVLGIVGLAGGMILGLPLVVSPVAWAIGWRAVREIDASGGALGGRSSAQAGYILGIIGTVFLALGVLLVVLYFVFIAAVLTSLFGTPVSCGPHC